MLPAAINQALGKAKQLHRDAMQSMAEGLNLPGLNEALAQCAAWREAYPLKYDPKGGLNAYGASGGVVSNCIVSASSAASGGGS